MSLDADPRWQRFLGRAAPCPCCGRTFAGVFDIAFDHPANWPHGPLRDTGGDALEVDGDSLTADLCVHDGQRYIRATLPIPIRGTEQVFAYGPWGSVSEGSYDAYVEAAYLGGPPFEGCFAWLANILPGTGQEDALPCNLMPHADPDRRPELYVHRGHPLHDWQRDGIDFDGLLDLYAAAGQDIRPHLTDA